MKDGTILSIVLNLNNSARFGDPEAMNVLSLLESDFIEICNGIADGSLNKVDVHFSNKATV